MDTLRCRSVRAGTIRATAFGRVVRGGTRFWANCLAGRSLGLRVLDSIECVVEHVEGCVQPFPAASVGLVAGLDYHVADQLVEVVLVARGNDVVFARARPDHEPFAVLSMSMRLRSVSATGRALAAPRSIRRGDAMEHSGGVGPDDHPDGDHLFRVPATAARAWPARSRADALGAERRQVAGYAATVGARSRVGCSAVAGRPARDRA